MLEYAPADGSQPFTDDRFGDDDHRPPGPWAHSTRRCWPTAFYTLRLTATDTSYNITMAYATINVLGKLKLGNLHLDFTDLTIPVAGIPITITRSYDTLNAQHQGDFGYGWTLGVGDFQLKVSQPDGSLADAGLHTPFVAGSTRVILSRPGMDPEGFTFAADHRDLRRRGQHLRLPALLRPRRGRDRHPDRAL